MARKKSKGKQMSEVIRKDLDAIYAKNRRERDALIQLMNGFLELEAIRIPKAVANFIKLNMPLAIVERNDKLIKVDLGLLDTPTLWHWAGLLLTRGPKLIGHDGTLS